MDSVCMKNGGVFERTEKVAKIAMLRKSGLVVVQSKNMRFVSDGGVN